MQVGGQARGAIAAVAFTDEVLAGLEAVVFDEVVVDDAGEVGDVLVGAVEELLGLVFRDEGAGEAGANGIDEDDIGEVEPGAGIVGEGGRVRGALAFGSKANAFGTDGAKVEVDRSRAGTAVEGEGDGTIWTVHRVGGEDHLTGGLAGVVLDREGADGGCVLEGLAFKLYGLGDVGVGRQWIDDGILGRGVGLFIRVSRMALGVEGCGGEGEQKGDAGEVHSKRIHAGRVEA